jgi:hypothetical protein
VGKSVMNVCSVNLLMASKRRPKGLHARLDRGRGSVFNAQLTVESISISVYC